MYDDNKMWDIIVVGAGTAGLTAAIYGQRAGKQVLLLESGIYGGQIVNAPEIENYPGIATVSGYQFAMNLYEQATGLGVVLENGKVIGIQEKASNWIVQTEVAAYVGKAVILATGAKHRSLGLKQEAELTGKGISYCATCDGAFYRGKTVAVIGGGNTALGDAEYLSNLCETVYLIHRREEFRGTTEAVERLKKRDNVRILLNTVVEELIGSEGLEALRILDKETGSGQQLKVDAAFVAIGQEPDNQAFASLVELDENGYIRAGEDCKTQATGVFAAGDCRTKQVRQLTTAAADGAVAAIAAVEYIEEK